MYLTVLNGYMFLLTSKISDSDISNHNNGIKLSSMKLPNTYAGQFNFSIEFYMYFMH